MFKATKTLLLLLVGPALLAQVPYTEKQFDWSVETNLVYGTATNYLGLTDTLTLDLYKPLNTDSTRPLVVLVHGGSWLGGCKEDMAWLCAEMAARGYVAATVNYRKGWHKDDYVPNPINAGIFAGGNCLYAADSLEIIRAIYRGMQDVKGAIRWLKARVYADSSCNQAVLVGGESAGAFLALAAGILDQPEEKPAACAILPDAPAPGANLANCYAVECQMLNHALPAGALARPDLGPVEGALNLNGFDANVQGVISFYGGVPSEALAANWLQGPDTPAFYLYHQTCDGIVPFNYGKPFFPISAYCNLGFTPWHYNLPFVFGNGAIASHLANLADPPLFQTDFLACNNFNPNLALFECLRYNDNGSFHYTHNRPERAEKIAAFFSPVIAARLNSPPCLVATGAPARLSGISLAPNPFRDHPVLLCSRVPAGPVWARISDMRGRLIWQSELQLEAGTNALPWPEGIPAGQYLLQLTGREGVESLRMIFLR
ncbi:MAG: carboxylesterase family protein [Lewinellaceae bacterium]|nr:carboxylesterase family protein [Lewinellaceae bacterium]